MRPPLRYAVDHPDRCIGEEATIPAATDRFRERARALGFDPDITSYPEGTRTAADAATAIGCDVAQIVKSLVLVAVDGGGGSERPERPILALTSGANRVDEAKLAGAVGAGRTRMANADEVRAATGFAIGGTPPFGHEQRLTTVVDPDLLGFDRVYAAAGTPTENFGLSPDDLVRLSGGMVVEFTAA